MTYGPRPSRDIHASLAEHTILSHSTVKLFQGSETGSLISWETVFCPPSRSAPILDRTLTKHRCQVIGFNSLVFQTGRSANAVSKVVYRHIPFVVQVGATCIGRHCRWRSQTHDDRRGQGSWPAGYGIDSCVSFVSTFHIWSGLSQSSNSLRASVDSNVRTKPASNRK
jgi:hypothetical protein